MRIKKISLVCCLAGLAAFAFAASENKETATKEESIEKGRARQKAKIEKFLDGRLPIGFYIYLYNWKQNKNPEAHDLDDAIKEMARRGFNYLYVGGASDKPLFSHLLDLCEKYKIAVVPQLDFAYLSNPKANVKKLVERATPFIKKYKDHPALMAFSVKEEPSVNYMAPLKEYYEGILEAVPDAPLHLLFSYLPPLVKMEPPYPGIIGTDRYGFWWEMSGHRATPWHALEWHRSQLALYYQLAVQRGADFQAVFTASTLESLATPEKIKKSFYGKGSKGENSEEAREHFYNRVQKLAAAKNFGWNNAPDGNLRYWKYYRPPVNCVRAMSWLGIMEGARSMAIWSWGPLRDDMKNFAHREKGKVGREYINTITGWDGKGTPQLEEYTEFIKQIQRYSKLIRAMKKECARIDNKKMPLGHELVSHTEGSKAVFEVKNNDANWQSFEVPGYSGKVILLVNSAVGSWCEGRSPRYLSSKDVFRINDFGEAIDYKPFKEPRLLTCHVPLKDVECIDLESGKPLPLKENQTFDVLLAPGGGRFFFLEPRGSSEWTRLKKQFSL